MQEFKNTEEELGKIRDGVSALCSKNTNYDANRFSWRTQPYLFSTENLKDSLNNLDFENKNVLTIAASGDHAFEAYRRGAKNVDMVDCNLFQKYVIELKHTLIKELKYSEFQKFFFNKPAKLNRDIYNFIKPNLSTQTITFFDLFFNSDNPNSFFRHVPFFHMYAYVMYKRGLIPYLDSQRKYNSLRRILPDKLNFCWDQLYNHIKKCTNKYDIIHLSNVAMYEKNFKLFYDWVIKPLMTNNIKDGGKLIANYDWGAERDLGASMQHLKILSLGDKSINCDIKKFQSVQSDYEFDAILMFKKSEQNR